MLLEMLAVTDAHLSLREALPVVLGLVLIEGLLSVDNALAIAAMASHLDPARRTRAINIGYIGAYGFRLLALLFAASIIENRWVKFFGALYLIWLMCRHFAEKEEGGHEDPAAGIDTAAAAHRAFAGTIMMIALMDLSLSVDNVVAAIALSPSNLWPVYLGVTIGIICLRLVAGLAVRMIERYPVLAHTAFLLVGYVGLLLLAELSFHLHADRLVKFAGIVVIIALSLLYATRPAFKKTLRPVLHVFLMPMKVVDKVIGWVFDLIAWPFRAVMRRLRKEQG